MKFVMSKFKSKFRSLYQVSDATLSMVAVLVMKMINESKAAAAVKVTASVRLRSLIMAVPLSGSWAWFGVCSRFGLQADDLD